MSFGRIQGDSNGSDQGYSKHKVAHCYTAFPRPLDCFFAVSEELRSDHVIIRKALQRNGSFLRDVILGESDEDVELIKVAMRNDVAACCS